MSDREPINLAELRIPNNVLNLIPKACSVEYGIIPIKYGQQRRDEKGRYSFCDVIVAVSDDLNEGKLETILHDLGVLLNRNVVPMYAAPTQQIKETIERHASHYKEPVVDGGTPLEDEIDLI